MPLFFFQRGRSAQTGKPIYSVVDGQQRLRQDRLGSQPAAVAGYASITVPAGFDHGLPVGVAFFGRAWSEATLLRIAYGFEQITKVRRKPEFLATASSGVPRGRR